MIRKNVSKCNRSHEMQPASENATAKQLNISASSVHQTKGVQPRVGDIVITCKACARKRCKAAANNAGFGETKVQHHFVICHRVARSGKAK